MLKILFFIAALSLHTHSQTSSGLLALSWLGGFCQDQIQNNRTKCDPSQFALWDQQSFTIHGFWADFISSQTYGNFNLTILESDKQLLDDMNNFWPPKSKSKQIQIFLWQHQWSKHGKDYATAIYKISPQEFPGSIQERNTKIQTVFYKQTIQIYQKYRLKKFPINTITKYQLANYLGLQQTKIQTYCVKNTNIIRQIRICVEITKQGFVPITCKKQKNICNGTNYILKQWKLKNQQRVTNYKDSENDIIEQ